MSIRRTYGKSCPHPIGGGSRLMIQQLLENLTAAKRQRAVYGA